MALKPCKECKKEVSDKANTCPNCGVSSPTTQFSDIVTGWTVIIVVVAALVYACSPSKDKSSSTADAAILAKQKEQADIACKKELSCWGDKHIASASAYCKSPIERLAKYSSKWTDGTFEMKFSRYRWIDESEGTLTYIGDKIQFQNGFGAFQNHIYQCDFDPATERPIDVRASPGTLPN